jgi:hypothetical protein
MENLQFFGRFLNKYERFIKKSEQIGTVGIPAGRC